MRQLNRVHKKLSGAMIFASRLLEVERKSQQNYYLVAKVIDTESTDLCIRNYFRLIRAFESTREYGALQQ